MSYQTLMCRYKNIELKIVFLFQIILLPLSPQKNHCMNDNNIMQQISSIFSVFMVMFYIGAGTFFIFFFDQSNIDKALRVIIGSSFLLYGTFRAFRAFFQIKKIFFDKETDDE